MSKALAGASVGFGVKVFAYIWVPGAVEPMPAGLGSKNVPKRMSGYSRKLKLSTAVSTQTCTSDILGSRPSRPSSLAQKNIPPAIKPHISGQSR